MTGFFRNIILNLRINCCETRKLGVDTHICELQLVLNSFAEYQVCPCIPFMSWSLRLNSSVSRYRIKIHTIAI